jgi:hypothetical protein
MPYICTIKLIKSNVMAISRNVDYLVGRVAKLEKERDLLNFIVKNGKGYINYHMTDCDGVHAQGSVALKSLDELYNFFDEIEGSIEGPFSWEVSDVPIESLTYGHGWDIN